MKTMTNDEYIEFYLHLYRYTITRMTGPNSDECLASQALLVEFRDDFEISDADALFLATCDIETCEELAATVDLQIGTPGCAALDPRDIPKVNTFLLFMYRATAARLTGEFEAATTLFESVMHQTGLSTEVAMQLADADFKAAVWAYRDEFHSPPASELN